MNMDSLWRQTVALPAFSRLERNINTDVLIIGGGLAGLLCAYALDLAGLDYTLVEADRICGGVTGNTTAKITSQHGLIYDRLLRSFGPERAKQYLRANERAASRYQELCRQLDCDYTRQDAYVYSRHDRGELVREVAALKRLGSDARLVDELPLPFPVAGAVCFPQQAQFHPLKFAAALAQGLHIYEQTPVLELKQMTAIAPHGRIRARRIVIATHFPFLNRWGGYFLKLYQQRSYVLALENAALPQGMYVDAAPAGMSLRTYGDLLLLGGGGQRTGKHGGGWQQLRDFAARYYPQARERFHWAAQDCMTLDGVPYIGPYAAQHENLYVATGFNKWGMTSAMTAALILCELLQGKADPDAAVFAPGRSLLRPQLAVNVAEATVNLLTPTAPRCPHLGCALKWNSAEGSWDCPCHGSRFSETGRLLDNPATGDLKRPPPKTR